MSTLQGEVQRLAEAAERHVSLLEREREEQRRRERERVGHRSEPRQLNFADFSRAVPGLIAYFERKVPAAFWTMSETRAVEVSCPCGATPTAELAVPIECAGEGCGRFYLFDGREVRVGGGPKAAPS